MLYEKNNTQIDKYIIALSRGDDQALSKLYDCTYKPLYSLCYAFFANKEDNEEALHSAYLMIKRKSAHFKGNKGFNWIYTITKNVCLNTLKQNKRYLSVDFQDEKEVNKMLGNLTLIAQPSCVDESGIMGVAKTVLSEYEYKILILHAVNDMKFKEISMLVNKGEATVRWQYNNALRKVRIEYQRRDSYEE